MKIKDYKILLEINKIEQCLTGYSLEFIKSITKDYKYHELIEKIKILIWYESSYDFSHNLDRLTSCIDNKRKNINSSKEFNWKEKDCLEDDYGFYMLSVFTENKIKERFNIDYKEDKNKYILNITLASLIQMLDYRSIIKNEDFNQFLDFIETIPIIKEFRSGINNLYKDNTSAAIKEIER